MVGIGLLVSQRLPTGERLPIEGSPNSVSVPNWPTGLSMCDKVEFPRWRDSCFVSYIVIKQAYVFDSIILLRNGRHAFRHGMPHR